MTAIAAWTRAELRRTWRSWLVLTVLVAALGGAALASAAGARRTASAYPRFQVATHTQGVDVSTWYPGLDRLPGVAQVGGLAGEPLLRVLPDGRVDARFPLPVASADGDFLYRLYRPVLHAGRLPRPDRPDEALATPVAVTRLHLHVGSRLTLRDMSGLFSPGGPAPMRLPPGVGRPVTFTIVGIGVFAEDVAAASARSQGGEGAFATVYLTPAYVASHGGVRAATYTGAVLRLRPGADLDRLRRGIDAIAARHPELGLSYDLGSERARRDEIQRAVRPEVVALWLFAGLVGFGALIIVGQGLARRAWAASGEFPALRAAGATRGQLVAGVVLPALGVACVGAVGAALVAVAASPLTPVGPARVAEPDPGVAVDLTVLAVGAAVVVAALAGRVALAAWRLTGTTRRTAVASVRLTERAGTLGLPAPAIAGLRMALDPGRGRRAVPVRSTVFGSALAVAAVAVVLVFNTSLARLESSPPRYGWGWDVAVDGGYRPLAAGRVAPLLAGTPGVAQFSGGNYGSIVIGGRLVAAVGIHPLRGAVFPTLLAGRAPRAPDEVALGTATMRAAGARLGGTVTAQVGGTRHSLRVVGEAVFPDFERGGLAATDLGDGAILTTALVHPAGIPPDATYNFFLVRFAPGSAADATRAAVERSMARAGCGGPACNFFTDRKPKEVNAYQRIRRTPLDLALLLSMLAVATLAHALVSSVRRRRVDLAILRTLGFVRAQVSGTVAWQATTIGVAAVAVGLPLGVAAGRWLWALFAHELGVAADPATPLAAVLLAVPVTVAVANVVAAAPAWTAARAAPGRTLRAE